MSETSRRIRKRVRCYAFAPTWISVQLAGGRGGEWVEVKASDQVVHYDGKTCVIFGIRIELAQPMGVRLCAHLAVTLAINIEFDSLPAIG